MTSRKTKIPKRPKTGTTMPPARKQAQATESRIVVRDRRTSHQFSVHNTVIDQWFPIIGMTGLAIYSLYVRMSNQKDERCWPGFTLIKSHLGISSSTLSDYNRLLTWCELLHIEPGNQKQSNNYYILDVPEVTPDKLTEIADQARKLPKSSRLKKPLLQRVKDWQPLQAHFSDRPKPDVVPASQLSLPIGGSSLSEPDSSLSELGSSLSEPGGSPGEAGSSLSEAASSLSEEEQSEVNNPKRTIRSQQSEGNNPKSTSSRTGRRNGGTADDADLPLSSLNDLMKSINIRDLKAQRKMVRLVEEHGYTLSELSVMYEIAREKADKNPTGYWMRWIESGQHMAGSSEGVDAMWEYYKSTADLPY
jgi:hypothetical protein